MIPPGYGRKHEFLSESRMRNVANSVMWRSSRKPLLLQ
jgi:hypothetical protein